MSDYSHHYHKFLRSRSLKAKIYRNYYLYPRLSKYLYGRTLDIGCGTGDFLAFYPKSIGVDVSTDNVNYCKSKNLNAIKIEENILPFDNFSIDSIVFDNVLEHITDPEPLLNEINRILKINGQLVVGVPGEKGFESAPDHICFYSPSDLKKTFSAIGFSCQNLFHTPFKSKYFDKYLKIYCYYGVFKKINHL